MTTKMSDAEIARRYLEDAPSGEFDIAPLAERMGRELFDGESDDERLAVYVRRAKRALDQVSRAAEPHHLQLSLESLGESWLVLGDNQRVRTLEADLPMWLRANRIHTEHNRVQNESYYRWAECFEIVTAILAGETPGTTTLQIIGQITPPDHIDED